MYYFNKTFSIGGGGNWGMGGYSGP
jgi:hypothetical protein